MFNPLSLANFIEEIPPLSDPSRAILEETTIDTHHPGTILPDWATMLDLIGEDGIEVSKKQCYFSMKVLALINEKLTHPILIDLKRPQQKSYAYIHGLYLLLRTSGITKVVHQGNKTKLVVNGDVLQAWQKLNPTEQYFILLEIWMFWANEEALDGYRYLPNLVSLRRTWELIPESGVKITAKNETVYNLNRNEELVNLAVLNLFGILDLQQGKPLRGKGWRLTYLAKTPWGEALIEMLNRSLIEDSSLYQREETEDVIYGKLKTHFQEFFPQWQQQLIIKFSPNQEGIYLFKASLDKAWRRISIPSNLTLESLVDTILEAFNFDKDHLYRFICQNRFGTPLYINHPQLEEPPYTNEFEVRQLPLDVGGRMIFHFDFGDDWEFQVLLEAINAPASKQQEAKIITSRGTAPPQYYYEDEDW